MLTSIISYGQLTNEISIVRDGISFTFSISCDNGPCQTGLFLTGDPWVVPNNPGGAVVISAITPSAPLNGAMVNPDLVRDPDNPAAYLPFDQQKQGLLSGYSHYDPELDLMNRLPYAAHGNESILKIAGSNQGCGTPAISSGCVQSAAVLTVLDTPPPLGGATTFRPPLHGAWKPQYTSDFVRLNRLPQLPQATNSDPLVLDSAFGFERWRAPQVELYHKGLGEFHRATVPHLSQTPYAADQARDFIEDLTKVFGEESEQEKAMAVYSLIQKGIDNYAVYKMGIPFGSGAGQHQGKKPPIVFFAAIYDDQELLVDVRSMASNQFLLDNGFFQEDSQIRMGNSGMAIWGDTQGVHWYFSRMYPKVDGKGTQADPYGYIDGPAGGVHPIPDENRDRTYLPISGGPHIGYALLQHLMPWFKYAANDFDILQWSDRIYDGYGIDNFEGGLWTLPDPVAPYDQDESGSCKPFKLYSTGITDCNLYGITWGPDLSNVEDFIAHDQDPMTYGRMPELHGSPVSFNRLPSVVRDHWEELRPCSDPDTPNYPCIGLGEAPFGLSLPVTYTHFTVQPDNNYVLIKWQTANEQNNAGFRVQRRLVGDANFTNIAWVEGRGNTQNLIDYSLKDYDLSDNFGAYYRLQQMDVDGSFNFSAIQYAQLAAKKSVVSIYPNPVSDIVTIDAGATEIVNIMLYDQLGTKIANTNTETVDVSGLSPGVYVLKITLATQKIVIKKLHIK